MKKSFLLVAAALVFVSCQKAEESAGVDESPVAVTFGADFGAEVTKAYSENTATEVQANGFKVKASSSNGSLSFNEKAVWGGSSYAPQSQVYYWPSGETVTFRAVYPDSLTIGSVSGAEGIQYTHNGDDDILAAYAADKSKSASSVALSFNHILSLVHFTAEGSDAGVTYKVKKIKVITPASGGYTIADATWIPDGTTAEDTYSSAVTTLSGKTTISGGLTVIPCNPTVYVEWSTYDSTSEALIADYSGTKALGVSMEQGKDCTINLKLPNSDASEISFSVSVNEWGAEDHDLTIE